MPIVPIESSLIKPIEFSEYLHKLIELPPLDTVNLTIERLIALQLISLQDGIGYITDLGRACAVFDVIPEIGKMLIAGYNYRCRDDIVNLAAIFEKSEYKMENVFDKFRSKTRDEALKKKEKENYDKIKNKWVNSLGDHFSLLDIYNEFCKREYDNVNQKTNAVITPKLGDTKEWCKMNYLNYHTLSNVKQTARQYQQCYGRVIRIFKEKHPDIKPRYLFTEKEPVIGEYSENILRAILDGFYINIIKRIDNRNYINCFPKEKSTAILPTSSLYASIRNPTKYGVYGQLKSIFGKQSYAVVSKIPPSIIEEYKKSKEGDCLESCWKNKSEKDTKSNNKKTDSKNLSSKNLSSKNPSSKNPRSKNPRSKKFRQRH